MTLLRLAPDHRCSRFVRNWMHFSISPMTSSLWSEEDMRILIRYYMRHRRGGTRDCSQYDTGQRQVMNTEREVMRGRDQVEQWLCCTNTTFCRANALQPCGSCEKPVWFPNDFRWRYRNETSKYSFSKVNTRCLEDSELTDKDSATILHEQ